MAAPVLLYRTTSSSDGTALPAADCMASAGGIGRTTTWDKPPPLANPASLSRTSTRCSPMAWQALDRTSTWDKPASTFQLATQLGHLDRTTTWDKPPVQSALPRVVPIVHTTSHLTLQSAQQAVPLDRTTTWDRPPVQFAGPLDRTETWNRPPLTLQPTSAPAPLDRTTTWDRPPLASTAATMIHRTTTWDKPPPAATTVSTPFRVQPISEVSQSTGVTSMTHQVQRLPQDSPLARTATILESSRVSSASGYRPVTAETRTFSDGSGVQFTCHSPIPALVPPTTLQRLQPLPESALQPRQTVTRPLVSRAAPSVAAPLIQTQQLLPTRIAPCVPSTASSPARRPLLQRAHTITVAEICRQTFDPPFPTMAAQPSAAHSALSVPGQSQDPGSLLVLGRAATVMPAYVNSGQPTTLLPNRPARPAPGEALTSTIVPQSFPTRSASSPRVMPQIEAPPRRETASAEAGRMLFSASLKPSDRLPRQLRLVVGGLMGSGKSTLCRMLRHLLGGTWVNQDEFSHLGKGAKRAFLAEVKRASGDDSTPVVLVDKINTLRQHRDDILQAMESGGRGDIVFVQLRHPQDKPGSWVHCTELCEARIRSRGEGHRTLKGTNPKLRGILQGTAKDVQAMAEDERRRFAEVVTADMTLSPVSLVMQLLSELGALELLVPPCFDLEELLREENLSRALQAAQQAEKDMAEPQGQGGGVQQRPASQGTRNKKKDSQVPDKEAPVWFWSVQLDSGSQEKLSSAWQAVCNDKSVNSLEPKNEHHVTMIYLGGGSDKEVAGRNPHLGSTERVADLRDSLARREGEEAALEVSLLAWDSRVAAAQVLLRGGLEQLCANAMPHITLALGQRVPAVASNELLARRAACLDLQGGLSEWLRQLGFQKYEEKLRLWCQEMGACSLEEVAEFAAEAAEAVADEASRDHVASVFRRAAPGEIQELVLSDALQLTGRIHGHRHRRT
eukprot:TRINITY_DN45356_c0_g1_i1.p1 TRINITY_DN45356_c0_g1~~TRINITY_DN45356_c0_g1_i1.p1  ORF type:complete len:960 (-),score=156.09 TRINITY_DN45356_c0_g1_i1:78-2957(-)